MKPSIRICLVASAALVSCRSVPVSEPSAAAATLAPAPAPAPTWVHTPPPAPLAAQPLPPPRVSKATLPNGLRLVVVEHHRRPVTVVSLFLPRGALTDPPSDAGLTEMAVTLAGDYYERNAAGLPIDEEKSFRRQVVDLGGAATFDVESDYSLVRISGYSKDAGAYLKMLAGAMIHPRHGTLTFHGRRNAALDAFEDIESADPEALQQVVAEAAFGEGHPYARSIPGTTSSLSTLGLEDVIRQQQEVLAPDGAVLVIVGDVEPTQVLSVAREAFAAWRNPESPGPLPQVAPPAVPMGASVGYLERRSASTLMVCATRPLPDSRTPDAALDLLATVLGEGPTSRLGSSLRESNGLTYGASAHIVHRRHARAFLACSALDASRAALGVKLFRQVLERARTTPPTAAELRRAKALRLAELDSSYDTAFDTTHTWLRAIALGTGSPRLDRERAEIEKVTSADLEKLARTVLSPKTIRWVLSGDRVVATRAVEGNGLGKLHKLSPGR